MTCTFCCCSFVYLKKFTLPSNVVFYHIVIENNVKNDSILYLCILFSNLKWLVFCNYTLVIKNPKINPFMLFYTGSEIMLQSRYSHIYTHKNHGVSHNCSCNNVIHCQIYCWYIKVHFLLVCTFKIQRPSRTTTVFTTIFLKKSLWESLCIYKKLEKIVAVVKKKSCSVYGQ